MTLLIFGMSLAQLGNSTLFTEEEEARGRPWAKSLSFWCSLKINVSLTAPILLPPVSL